MTARLARDDRRVFRDASRGSTERARGTDDASLLGGRRGFAWVSLTHALARSTVRRAAHRFGDGKPRRRFVGVAARAARARSRARASRFSGGPAPLRFAFGVSSTRGGSRGARSRARRRSAHGARGSRGGSRGGARGGRAPPSLRRAPRRRRRHAGRAKQRRLRGILLLHHHLVLLLPRFAGPTRTTRETSRTRTNPRIASVGAGRTTRTTPSPPRARRVAGAPSRARPPAPDPDPDAFAARYTDEDIARMQIDGLTHAAVFDEAASRIDREAAAADLRRLTPEFAALRHVGEPGARPPRVALPSDPESKACICRYTYDRNELERAGEDYALEGRPRGGRASATARRDARRYPPATVRESCRGANPGYSRTVLLQAFDWLSSKTGDAGWWRRLRAMAGYLASAGITHAWLPRRRSRRAPRGTSRANSSTSTGARTAISAS